MIEWSEQHQLIRDAVRKFVDAEIVPKLEDLEHGDLPPYEILRKLIRSFGMDDLARARFAKQIAREEAGESAKPRRDEEAGGRGDAAAMQLIPIIELSRYCPGMVTAMGVSMGLTGAAILSKGTLEQKKRWGLDLLTLDKIGAWAITEPGSGSDAFGSMKASARRHGGGYLLNGNKTFITNGPYADTIVFICKLDEPGVPARDRKVLSFVLDRGMPGLTQSKPMRKMGLHSSPTGELFLQDVEVGPERLLGGSETRAGGREGAKDTFSMERSGVAAMALGIVERCLELSLRYARERVQFGRPIGEFQLIQEKLARMEVARMNIQNLVFKTIEAAELGRGLGFAEASAMKLYSARAATEVALEAVQIYAGTDEIQISAIARDLLAH
jgi:alkylation response protein AidB-like acyl-CoA dehydrogenase